MSDYYKINKLDIVQQYCIDLFYTKYYNIALNYNNNNDIKTNYKNLLLDYLKTLKSNDYQKQTIMDIHTYCINSTKYKSITEERLIVILLKEIIPNKILNKLSNIHKFNLINKIIKSIIIKFVEQIIKNYIIFIIDNHNIEETKTVLSDILKYIITIEKNMIFIDMNNLYNHSCIIL